MNTILACLVLRLHPHSIGLNAKASFRDYLIKTPINVQTFMLFSSQETLVSKIKQLEGTIQELKDEPETNRATFQQKLRAKEKVVGDQEEEIKDMKSKMEGMAAEFGDMLKKTLDKMKERIELNSANFEEQSVPINKRLEEFNLKD